MKQIIWVVSFFFWMYGPASIYFKVLAATDPSSGGDERSDVEENSGRVEDPLARPDPFPGGQSLLQRYLQVELRRLEASTQRLENELEYLESLLNSINYPYRRIQPEPHEVARQAALARARFYAQGKHLMLHSPSFLIAVLSTIGTNNHDFLLLPALTIGVHASIGTLGTVTEYVRVYRRNRFARALPSELHDHNLAHAKVEEWIDPLGWSLLASLQVRLQEPSLIRDKLLYAESLDLQDDPRYVLSAIELHPLHDSLLPTDALPLTVHEFQEALSGSLSLRLHQLNLAKKSIQEANDQAVDEVIQRYRSHLSSSTHLTAGLTYSEEYRFAYQDELDSRIKKASQFFEYLAHLISRHSLTTHRIQLARLALELYRETINKNGSLTPATCSQKILELREVTPGGAKDGMKITAHHLYQP